jgi:hypothetical protein
MQTANAVIVFPKFILRTSSLNKDCIQGRTKGWATRPGIGVLKLFERKIIISYIYNIFCTFSFNKDTNTIRSDIVPIHFY